MKSPLGTGAIRNEMGEESNRHFTHTESPSQRHFSVTCLSFRAFSKNTLLGFATLLVAPPIADCALHEKNGKRWVNFPARQYTGDDGAIRWQPLFTIEDKRAYWEFQSMALAAIDQRRAKP